VRKNRGVALEGSAVVSLIWNTGEVAEDGTVVANITAALMVPGLFPQSKTFGERVPAHLRDLVVPGRSLPVLVEERHPHDLRVDWPAFERAHG
jgi:hypothetical protein